MRRLLDSKGHIMYSALAVAVLAALVVFYAIGHQAEAVLGGSGNVTDTNNPHNFAYGSSGVAALSASDTRICVFCHTPHSAITGDAGAPLLDPPLWNHELSQISAYTVSNVPGSSGTQLAQPSNQPDGASRLCLSCHDGTVGVGDTRSVQIAMDTSHPCLDSQGRLISGSGCTAYLGTDLSTHHLVSIPVNGSLIAGKQQQCDNFLITENVTYPWSGLSPLPSTVLLRPTTTIYNGQSGINGDDAVLDGAPSSLYKSGYNYGVQCSSCHDPHDWILDNNNGYWDAREKFLVTDFNSLCQACHDLCV